jgi:hypothetical protein
MRTDPAEYAPTVAATYSVRHVTTSVEAVAGDIMTLLASGIPLIDLSDHDRRADTVRLRTKGDAIIDGTDR